MHVPLANATPGKMGEAREKEEEKDATGAALLQLLFSVLTPGGTLRFPSVGRPTMRFGEGEINSSTSRPGTGQICKQSFTILVWCSYSSPRIVVLLPPSRCSRCTTRETVPSRTKLSQPNPQQIFTSHPPDRTMYTYLRNELSNEPFAWFPAFFFGAHGAK